MKTLNLLIIIILISVLSLPGFSQDADSQTTSGQVDARQFRFNFGSDLPLTYAMKVHMMMDMNIRAGVESLRTKMEFELRCNLKMTPKAQKKNDTTTLAIETTNIEGDWDITVPNSHIVLNLCDANMVGTQNGIVIINTEKNIGIAQAREFKNEIMALYLSGEMDIDSKGYTRDIRGDLPFVEFWKEAHEGEKGLFGIIFPEEAIPIDRSWNENLSLKKMGDILLEGEGLSITITFTRKPDTIVADKLVQVFSLSSPFDQKDLTGHIEQMGQNTRLNIPNFSRTASGTVQFDADKGVIVDARVKMDGKASMNAIIEGQAMIVDMIMQADTDMRQLTEKEQGK